MKRLREEAQSVWDSVRSHLESLSQAKISQSSDVVRKICDAIVQIDPALKDSCFTVNVPVKTASRVSLSPSHASTSPPVAQVYFPAIDSAKLRLKSAERFESSLAKSVKEAEKRFSQAHASFCFAYYSSAFQQQAANLASKQAEKSRSFASSITNRVFSTAMVSSAQSLVGASEQLTMFSRRSNAAQAYQHASNVRAEAYKSMNDVKAEHAIAAQEVEEARSYLKELEKKFEVIDADADTPVQKRARSS